MVACIALGGCLGGVPVVSHIQQLNTTELVACADTASRKAVDTLAGYANRACEFSIHPDECSSMVRRAHALTSQAWLPVATVDETVRHLLEGAFLQSTVVNFTIRILKSIPVQTDELLIRNVIAPMLSTALRFTSWGRSGGEGEEGEEEEGDVVFVETVVSRAVANALEDMERALRDRNPT